MVQYDYDSHLCLAIIAQGNWTDRIKEDFFQEINNKFLEFDKGDVAWDEKQWHQVSLFDPNNPRDNEEWGVWGKIFVCNICKELLKFLEKHKRTRDGIILFTHTSIEPSNLKELLELIIKHKKTKKIYYLTIGEVSSKGKISSEQLNEIINRIQHSKLPWTDFVLLIQDEDLKSYVNYEIIKDQYY